jgi:hypothetical protein
MVSRHLRTASSIFLSLSLFAACSANTSSPSAPAPAASSSDQPTDPAAGDPTPPADPPPALDACGAIPKSKCSPANEGSIVRGIVKFDPAHFAGKPKPTLRIFLHHQVVLKDSEGKQGGHPHAWTSATDVDVDKGEAHFTLDQCEFGTAMYSEENCGFNLVALLDEDGSHDPDVYGEAALMPKQGELVKLTPLTISCHAPSSCLSITADCADGEACTTYTPLAISACKCAASSCQSDSVICSK